MVKKKHQRWNRIDFNCQTEEIEAYESSSHEERKDLFKDIEKNEHFFYILLSQNHANDETEEKEEHLQIFSPAE